ncbi:hypothetical protein H4I96_11804 [Botrytis cinerea]
MAELECIEPSERFGRVHSRVVEVRTAPASRHLYHDEAVSEDEYTSEWRLHLITLALSMDIFFGSGVIDRQYSYRLHHQ